MATIVNHLVYSLEKVKLRENLDKEWYLNLHEYVNNLEPWLDYTTLKEEREEKNVLVTKIKAISRDIYKEKKASDRKIKAFKKWAMCILIVSVLIGTFNSIIAFNVSFVACVLAVIGYIYTLFVVVKLRKEANVIRKDFNRLMKVTLEGYFFHQYTWKL